VRKTPSFDAEEPWAVYIVAVKTGDDVAILQILQINMSHRYGKANSGQVKACPIVESLN
jgi:hypothetical protein